jgi:hypothetical protein
VAKQAGKKFDFDTSWFKLENYDSFKIMSIEDWANQLKIRATVDFIIRNFLSKNWNNRSKVREVASSYVEALKNGFVLNMSDDNSKIRESLFAIFHDHPFSTASVNSLTNINVRSMELSPSYREIWDDASHELLYYLRPDHFEELPKKAIAPYNFNDEVAEPVFDEDEDDLAYVTIDITATDEQIKSDLAHWLTHYRKAKNYEAPSKKKYTQADFDHWVKFGFVPYLDLMLIAKFEEKRISDESIGALIFVREHLESYKQRVIRETRDDAWSLLNNKIYQRLESQLASEKLIGR